MPIILIVYNTKTGNTELMANAIAKGAQQIPSVRVNLTYHATPDDLKNADGIIIGVPTYNHNITMDIQNLLEKTAQSNISLKGKVAATFGSYGWSGEAPQQVSEILKQKFQMDVREPPIRAKYKPDHKILEECLELGKSLAETVMNR